MPLSDDIASGAVRYAREPALDVEEFRQVLVDSDLGARRPVADDARLRAMLAGAGICGVADRTGAWHRQEACWTPCVGNSGRTSP